MRIGIFSTPLAEPSGVFSSVAGFLDTLAASLTERGHTVIFFSAGDPPADAVYRHVRIGTPRFVGSRTLRTTVMPLLLHRLNDYALDVAHLNGDDWFFFRRRVPTIRTFYGSALMEAIYADLPRRRVKYATIFPLEALSARLADVSFGIGPDSSALYRTSGTLPLALRSTARPSDGAKSSQPTVMTIGTWGGRKRVRDVYAAFERFVLPGSPQARLCVVCPTAPPAAPWLDWHERPDDVELTSLYAKAWVFASASQYEGFGLPYLEAMSQGTAVVARANPGSIHVLGGGAYGALAESAAKLGPGILRLLQEDARRETLVAAGIARAGEFSIDRVTDAHEGAYRQAIDAFRP